MRCTIMASFVLLLTGRASADPEVLFAEGRALTDAGKLVEGCAKFQQAYDEEHKPGIAANLASCAERDSEFPKAWRLYQEAAALWKTDKRADAMRDAATAVARKATTVVIGVPDPDLADLAITVNGRPVKPAREIRELVMPGTITFEGTASGMQPWKRAREGHAGETLVVEIEFKELPRSEATAATTTTTQRRRSWIYLSLGMGAAGVGGLVTSYLLAKSADDDYDAILANPMYCMNGNCNPEGQRKVDDTQSRATRATVIGVAGAAVAIGAVVVFFLAPKDTIVVPTAGKTEGGVAIVHRF